MIFNTSEVSSTELKASTLSRFQSFRLSTDLLITLSGIAIMLAGFAGVDLIELPLIEPNFQTIEVFGGMIAGAIGLFDLSSAKDAETPQRK